MLEPAFLPMPPSPHPAVGWAFTLRGGGVSQGPWGVHEPGCSSEDAAKRTGFAPGGLNLGLHTGDDLSAVRENRRRVAAAIGHPVSWLTQVHGIRVLDLDETGKAHGVVSGANLHHHDPEADAQITTLPGIALAVQVADCLPVLLADTQGRVIGAAHAGWRGLAAGVLEVTVQAMRSKVPDANLVAWLGPCIGPAAFEVGDDVRAAFLADTPDAATAAIQPPDPVMPGVIQPISAASAFQPRRGLGKWLANLPLLARLRLQALGITTIHTAGHCTFSEPEHFWSYRRSTPCGRMAGLLWTKTRC